MNYYVEEEIVRERSVYGQEESPYILISYGYTDRNKVLPLIRYLDDGMGGCFHIRYDLTIDLPMKMDDWKMQEIENSHAVLVFVSKSFKSNLYFDQFMSYTKHCRKTVIICYLDRGMKMPVSLGLPLKSYHYMCFDHDNRKEFSDELTRLGKLRGCRTGILETELPFELMNQYRVLVPLQPDFFMPLKNEEDDIYDKFENYSEFHREGRPVFTGSDPEGIYQAAEDLLAGTYYVQRNPYRAVKLLEKAAEMDYLPAIQKLAYCYQRGIGTRKDFVKAEKYFRKAALKGDASSMFVLALLLCEGRPGVKINKKEGFQWLKKAVDKGNVSAWYYLGFCYEHGSGTEIDILKALTCYRSGAEKNDLKSQQAYDALIRRL